MRLIILVAALVAISATSAFAERAADPLEATIETRDVDAFYQLYDAANGRPNASNLQSYIDSGSAGVQGFIPDRIVSGDNLASAIESAPGVYANARTCARQLGNVRERVRAAFLALKALYPEATFPQTYILIGANNSGGTANDDALMIGLEVVCRSEAPDSSATDIRLTHLIAHEMIHSQQRGFEGEIILSQSLTEGAAEFLGELISGRVANIHLVEWTRGNEADIEHRFSIEMGGQILQNWLYNGVGTPGAPGDLGYWVGYRIVRRFYEGQADKRAAVRTILESNDARHFLEESGWRPASERQ